MEYMDSDIREVLFCESGGWTLYKRKKLKWIGQRARDTKIVSLAGQYEGWVKVSIYMYKDEIKTASSIERKK